MKAIVGALRVVLGMDSTAFEKGANAAEKRTAQMRRSMENMGRSMQRIGAGLSAAVTAPLVAMAYKSVDAMKTQERAVAAVDAALASMGDQAGFTSDELQAMASRLQGGSLFGDEEILQKVTANLLTFGNISGEVFERASALSLDLSARLGQDLQSSAIMLGKALNDPVKGLTALSRVGVSFTKEQEEMIKAMAKAGDVAGAQALMLAELERQYAGQAAAMAGTDSGRIQQASMAIGDAMEKIGAVILPVMAEIADKVKAAAEWFQTLDPSVQSTVVKLGALAAAIGPGVAALGTMMILAAPLAGLFTGLSLPILATAAVIGSVAYAIWQHRDAIAGAAQAVFRWLGDMAARVGRFVQPVIDAARRMGEGMADHFRLAAQLVAQIFRGDFAGAFDTLHGIVANAVETAQRVLGALFGEVTVLRWRVGLQRLINTAVAWLAVLAARVRRLPGDIAEGIRGGIQAVRDAMADVWQAIREEVASWPSRLVEAGRNLIGGLVSGITGDGGRTSSAVRKTLRDARRAAEDEAEIKSPSKVFERIGAFLMDGLAAGIDTGAGAVLGSVERASQSLTEAMRSGLGAEGALAGVTGSLEAVGSAADNTFFRFGGWLADLAKGTTTLRDKMRELAQSVANTLGQSGLQGLTGFLSGAIGPTLGGIAGGFLGNLMGFRDGGSFKVGGVGGIDSQVVAFKASPDETVSVTRPDQSVMAFAPLRVRVEASDDLRVTAAMAGAEAATVVYGDSRRMDIEMDRRSAGL